MATEQEYLENKEHYEGLDKRTNEYKAYKEWKENFDKANSIGLGDVVEKITEATGIKRVVEAITDDCGCKERKDKLNETRLKRRKPYRCFTEEEYDFLTMLFSKPMKMASRPELEKAYAIEEDIYKKKRTGGSCGNCNNSETIQMYNDLKLIYETYQDNND